MTLVGLWPDILDALNQAGIAPDRLRMFDIEQVKRHRFERTGEGDPRPSSNPIIMTRAQFEAKKRPVDSTRYGTAKEALGLSRGGFSTRNHLRINGVGLPMRTGITAGQDSNDAS